MADGIEGTLHGGNGSPSHRPASLEDFCAVVQASSLADAPQLSHWWQGAADARGHRSFGEADKDPVNCALRRPRGSGGWQADQKASCKQQRLGAQCRHQGKPLASWPAAWHVKLHSKLHTRRWRRSLPSTSEGTERWGWKLGAASTTYAARVTTKRPKTPGPAQLEIQSRHPAVDPEKKQTSCCRSSR